MNKNSLLNEGLIDAIFDLLKKRKIKKLQKKFRNQPEIKNTIDRINRYSEKLEDDLRALGIEPIDIHRIK
jgi:hypothetical protein